MFLRRKLLQITSILVILTILFSGFAPQHVRAQGGDGLKREVNPQTGKVSFLGPESGSSLSASQLLGISPFSPPADPALALAKRFGGEFGLKSPERDLSQMKSHRAENGRITARYQQNYEGIPVMGGELIVNTNDSGDLYSMSGEVSPDLSLSIEPRIDSEQATQTALQAVAKWYQKPIGDFQTSEPELWIFDESLLQPSTRPAELVWRMEVTPKDIGMPVRELVLVNAQRGGISLHFNQIDTAWNGSVESKSIYAPAAPTCSIQRSNAGTQLFTYAYYNCGLDSSGVGAGDFNNDGKEDVALSVATSVGFQRNLLVFLQDNSGSLSQPIAYPGGNLSDYLAVGDLNHDGRDDIVTVDAFDRTMSVYLQTNSGNMANRVVYSINTLPEALAIGDINNDGRDDIVITHYSTISVFTQKNDGTLNAVISYPAAVSEHNDIAIGDINNDGLNDVVNMKGGGTTETLLIYTQNNMHILNPYYSISNCAWDCGGRGIEIGDVSGDGRADVVMSFGGNGNSAKIAVFPQTSSGNLGFPIIYPSKDVPSAMEIADIDLDNKLDVIVLHSGIYAGTYSQQDNGSLGLESLYYINSKSHFLPQDLSVGDINNDGLPDILVAAWGLQILYRTLIPVGGGHRLTYTANQATNLPGQLRCDETKPFCTNGVDPHADAAHVYAGGIWNLYHDKHGRDSIDNKGMTIISSVHYSYGYDNAMWNGEQMVYGDAYGYPLADDVVAHELTHGVTQYESNLFYYYQSGAINESFSDLWGEYYDQTNGLGNDASGVKWQMGEDVSGQGALRNMSNPPAFGDPDKMSSSYYYEGEDDNGGVHFNSGVNNKAVYLMVDGGTFNGKTVLPLGWDKTAAVYYEANTNLLSSGADYFDLYYALQQACTNLIGQKDITAGDCTEVKDAVDAVEMNGQPAPNFNTDAPLCDTGSPVTTILSDDFEAGTGNWTFTNGAYPRWQVDSPDFGPYAQSGLHSLYADDYPDVVTDASARLKSFLVQSNTYLRFAQAYDFESGYLTGNPTFYNFDGGVLEYSTNNGATWQDPGSLIDVNGYKGAIATGWSNPLSTRSAFVGTSHGYITTRLNLYSLVGQTVGFRWRMGLDLIGYSAGWWVDNIQVYTCPIVLGKDTTGVFRPTNGLLYLKNSNNTGFADAALNYGLPGDYPVVGDWDGNGTVTIGIYRDGSFYLKNANTLGFAEVVFPFGNPGDQPVAGDWDGDGVDTIGVFHPSDGHFFLRNSNTEGPSQKDFYLGNPGDVGIAGDWNGDGMDTTGVFRPSNGVIFLKDKNESGFADYALNYGLPGDRPVMGDWNNDGKDTIGIYRNGSFYLRNSNTNGFAELIFGLGNPGDMPIAGNWDGLP